MTRGEEINQPQRLGGSELHEINLITHRVIGCAIAVHRALGLGLLEGTYDSALRIELDDQGIRYARLVLVPAYYKGRLLGQYRMDFLVEDRVIVEVKSVAVVLPIFEAQLHTYLRVTAKRIGLLINFNTPVLKDGITRVIL